MDDIKKIVDEIHAINPKNSKSKILLYLLMVCNPFNKDCKKCPLDKINLCDIHLRLVLKERELTRDMDSIRDAINAYIRGVRA